MTRVKIHHGLICDDVRKEDNGKLLIIGAYGTNIGVLQFPATLVLTCLVIGTATEELEAQVEFRALYNDDLRAEGKGRLKVGWAGDFLLALPSTFLPNLTEPGTLVFRVKQFGGKWETVRTINVEQSQS